MSRLRSYANIFLLFLFVVLYHLMLDKFLGSEILHGMFWSQEPMTHRLLLGVNFGRWIFWGIIEGPKDFSF